MESAKLLESLFDRKVLVILKLFFNRKDQELTLKEVSKYSKVPLASTYRILNKLVALEIINRFRTKHLKTYKLFDNEKTRFLNSILEQKKTIIDEFLESIIGDNNISFIILHGREEKDKANILIIGEGIDNHIIRQNIVSIKEKYNFTITYMLLTLEQYNQMVAMNLYSGKKEMLFQR